MILKGSRSIRTVHARIIYKYNDFEPFWSSFITAVALISPTTTSSLPDTFHYLPVRKKAHARCRHCPYVTDNPPPEGSHFFSCRVSHQPRSSVPEDYQHTRSHPLYKSQHLLLAPTMSDSPKLTLKSTLPLPHTSSRIPQLGFGVYLSPVTQCVTSCLTALKAGYRQIDTAQFYANEREVGLALRQCGLPRDEVFVTTKIPSAAGSVLKSYEKCVRSVELIAGDAEGRYVDCFLIHSPNSGREKRKEMWLALERLKEEGRARCIGVSNYGIGQIEEMKDYATTWPPSVNQIELHPWLQQREIVDYCHQNGIVVQAYSPLVRNYKAHDPALVGVAERIGKTTAQVLIRYCLQKGWVPLPKSDNPDRIKANADVYDFEIGADDMATLDGLDQGDQGAIVQAVRNH